MNILKKIPIAYQGQLHGVQLVNFSVEREEVEPYVPWKIKIRDFNGRALISMVNVYLKNMHPTFVPQSLNFEYRHIGFRLLVDDSQWNEGQSKGIYFIRSFTDKALIAQGGQLMTDYNLEKAEIICTSELLALKKGTQFLTYALDEQQPDIRNKELYHTIASIDRAYSHLDGQIRMTQIQREKWPIEWANCYHFQTNFFETAQFEGAFRVNETIYYQWEPPKNIR
jgi:uncharacterized protein YqjF (DUF2071 family)